MTANAGSVRAMDAVFRNDYAWLRRWLNVRPLGGLSAEDVASETLLRMVQIADREQIREPRAMMTTIARRILFDLRAKGDLQRAYERAIVERPPELEPSPEQHLLVLEALRRIEKTLGTLSVKARSAFLLSQIDGLRHAEIADALGVSISMVRKYIANGMKACYNEFLDE